MERSFTNQHRCKCKLIALFDLIWRLGEFLYSILELVAQKMDILGFGMTQHGSNGELVGLGTIFQKSYRTHKVGPHGIAMISPLLSFLYILATLLQVAVAIIMFKACNGKVPSEQEMGACTIWCRVSTLSFFVAILLFLFPFIQSTVLGVSYFVARVTFILLGLLVAKLHIRNLYRLIIGPDEPISSLPF